MKDIFDKVYCILNLDAEDRINNVTNTFNEYDINNISHTAIYVGDNKMIHSTHPGEGVLVSNIDYWKRGSGTSIVGIRRVG